MKYSVHAEMNPKDIARVMEHRELINRKFDSGEIGHEFMAISIRFLESYTGDFAWMHQMKARYAQYGRLFASQSAGILNVMVNEIKHELRDGVRQHKKETGLRKKSMLVFASDAPKEQ